MGEDLDTHPTVVTIQREWRRLNETLDSLTPEHMERPAFDPEFGGAPWTVKDLLVHIAAWKRNTIRVIELVRADPASVPGTGTPDEILEIDFEAFNGNNRLGGPLAHSMMPWSSTGQLTTSCSPRSPPYHPSSYRSRRRATSGPTPPSGTPGCTGSTSSMHSSAKPLR